MNPHEDQSGIDCYYCNKYKNYIDELKIENTELKKKMQAVVEALKWYADGMPWRDDVGSQTDLAKRTIIALEKEE